MMIIYQDDETSTTFDDCKRLPNGVSWYKWRLFVSTLEVTRGASLSSSKVNYILRPKEDQ